jgi:hypothetical protein
VEVITSIQITSLILLIADPGLLHSIAFLFLEKFRWRLQQFSDFFNHAAAAVTSATVSLEQYSFLNEFRMVVSVPRCVRKVQHYYLFYSSPSFLWLVCRQFPELWRTVGILRGIHLHLPLLSQTSIPTEQTQPPTAEGRLVPPMPKRTRSKPTYFHL